MRTHMTKMFKIALPDGSVKEMPEGSTPADVAAGDREHGSFGQKERAALRQPLA